jgi:NAD(P)-dependent dehydrogenase (short-subunit alcohol dehydrogenase family)
MSGFSRNVLQPGKVAVITGASSGIGRALAFRCVVQHGMHCVLVDVDKEELTCAAALIAKARQEASSSASPKIVTEVVNVADRDAVMALADRTFATFGSVHLLVNNAGIGGPGGSPITVGYDALQEVMNVNAYGPIHGCQAFIPKMKVQHLTESQGGDADSASLPPPCYVINTGSKQGITMPPGNIVYNMSKAALKCYTEGLEHELMLERQSKSHNIHSALLIPGWVNTSIVLKSQRAAALAAGRTDYDPVKEAFFYEDKPAAGAWMPAQVVDFLFQELELERFYIVCPDHDVTREMDNLRMTWTMQDITQNRPPLSRWHPDHKDAFNEYVQANIK